MTAREVIGNEKIVSINYKALPREIKVGAHIMLDDGTKKLLVHDIKGEEKKRITLLLVQASTRKCNGQ